MNKNELILMEQLSKFPYYTKQNLSLVLKKDGFSLDYWIKKLVRDGILIPLKKGFYTSSFYLNEIKKKGFLDLYRQELANVLRRPSYVSLESALSFYGLIPEETFNITSITLKSTRTYKNSLGTFIYRNIKKELFLGYNKITETNLIYRATKAKALFDWLYLKKFDGKEAMKNFLQNKGRINWFNFSREEKEEFDQYVKISQSKKMILISVIINSLIKNG